MLVVSKIAGRRSPRCSTPTPWWRAWSSSSTSWTRSAPSGSSRTRKDNAIRSQTGGLNSIWGRRDPGWGESEFEIQRDPGWGEPEFEIQRPGEAVERCEPDRKWLRANQPLTSR
eukprot:3570447-Alexandrium_andersonii.AAC.1